MFRHYVSIAAAALLLSAVPALAHDGDGHGRPFFDGACASACRQSFQTCFDAARSERATCAEGCSALVDAAKSACEGSVPGTEPSAECAAARAAARECLRPCRDGFRSDRDSCLSTLRQCVGACPVATPGTPSPRPTPSEDQLCLRGCREARNQCVEGVQQAQETCRRTCTDQANAVADACRRRHPTEECRAAVQGLWDCLQPCREAAADSLQACGSAAEACVTGCRGATPTPTSAPQP